MRDWQRYRDFFGPSPERELADELRFHFETEIDELVASGLTVEEARHRAHARFGDVERFAAECRASDARRLGKQRRARIIDVVRQDLHQAIRALRSRPVVALTVVIVLAIGLGANAAVFSIVDHVFLRPPAGVTAPSEISRLFVERRRDNGTSYFQVRFSLPEAHIIDSVVRRDFPSTIFFRRDVSVDIGGARRALSSSWVAPTYFSVLGVTLYAGSMFDGVGERFGSPAGSAIVSWSLWQGAFGGDPNIIGRAIRVDDRWVTVRGIAAAGFSGIDVDATDLWLPLSGFMGFDEPRGHRWFDDWGLIAFRVVARAPADSMTRLVADVEAAVRVSARVARETNPERQIDTVMRVIPAPLLTARGPERLSQREALAAVLAGLAVLLLLIAVANAANLLIGRALDRQREIAIRLALGMSRARIYTQVATESLVLTAAAIAAAALAASWLGTVLRRMVFPSVDFATAPVDARLFAVVIGVGVVASFAASIAPLQPLLRVDLTHALKSGVREGGGRRSRVRSTLVGVQAALSAILLVGTALFGRSLVNVRTASLGLEAERLIVVKAPEDGVTSMPLPDIAALARTLPEVAAVSLAGHPPLWDQFEAERLFTAGGDSVENVDRHVGYVAGDVNYLATIGTRIVRGRDFAADDKVGAVPVMIVSEELARRVWPTGTPLGECLRIGRPDDVCRTIVGVAENARRFEIVEEPEPTFYIPLDQHPLRSEGALAPGAVIVRAAGSTDLIRDRLRAALGDTATTLRGRQVVALSEVLAPQYAPWELGVRLFGGFASLALALALFGLYGVLSYVVSARSRELGVRVALGAGRARLLTSVLTEAMRYVSVGVLAGVLIAIAAASRVEPLLFHVSPHDPAALMATLVALVVGVLLAAAGPARRAMAIDPAHVLKSD